MRPIIAEGIGRLNSRNCPFSTFFIITKDSSNSLALLQFIANLYLDDEPNSWIDVIFDAHAAAAGFGNRIADFFRVDRTNKAGARRFYLKRLLCQRQNPARLVAHLRVATLRLDV